MDKIKWGFIGCGRVVQHKSGKAFNEVHNSCVYAIMRRDLNAAKQSAYMFGAPQWYNSVEGILSSDVDAIYIATPPGLHFEQAMACCDAGKPIYIEKPFARNYTEAKAITDAFAEKEIPIFVGHYRRALPRFQFVKDLINNETIGRVTSVQSYLNRMFSRREAQETWLYNPALSGGGKFYDIAAHSLDIIAFLFGNIVEIHGFAANSETECPLEDTVVCSYVTENGILGAASFNCISDKKNDRMFVNGTKGSLEFSIHGQHDVVVLDYTTGKTNSILMPDPEVIEQPMIQTVVDNLLNKGICQCTAMEALPTYWAIDQILDKFYHGRQRQFWKSDGSDKN